MKKKKLKIPIQFEAFGHTVRTKYVSELMNEGQRCYGVFDPVTMDILLDMETHPSLIEETFCHEWAELANCMLDLNLPHPSIQALGALLHQLLTSAKYERKKRNAQTDSGCLAVGAVTHRCDTCVRRRDARRPWGGWQGLRWGCIGIGAVGSAGSGVPRSRPQAVVSG